MSFNSTSLILGMHDPPPISWLGRYMAQGGWIVHTVAVGHDSSDEASVSYDRWALWGNIVRINHGYGSDGTVPPKVHVAAFIDRAVRFVAGSSGCNHWIIGNEPNHVGERPKGTPIDPEWYATRVYLPILGRILELPGHESDLVMPAPVAMWYVDSQSGDWISYYKTLLQAAGERVPALAWHTYTHGSDPQLIRDESRMDPPFEAYHYHFRAYQDLHAVLEEVGLAQRPIFITETDQSDVGGVPCPWADVSGTTWIREALDEIAEFRKRTGADIRCLACYRWPVLDSWGIEGKSQVYNDFDRAMQRGIRWDSTEEEVPMPQTYSLVYQDGLNEFFDPIPGSPEVTIPVRHTVAWDGIRPEFDAKVEPQPEVYPESLPKSAVGFHRFTEFHWWARTEPISVTLGALTKADCAFMIIAHGVEGDAGRLGDCGVRLGISPSEVTDRYDSQIVWSEWGAVRPAGEPGANMLEGRWQIFSTPEGIASTPTVVLWIEAVNNVASDIAAVHWDLERVWQVTDEPVPPPAGMYEVKVFDPTGAVVASVRFEVSTHPETLVQVCGLAQQIVDLACPQ